MILEKADILEAMSEILADPNHNFECVQLATIGPDRCAILFETGDSDHNQTLSILFDVEGFDPARAKPIMITDEWMFSVSATRMEDLSVLDVGRDVWRGAPDNWARNNAADWFNNRLWCFAPDRTFLIGEHGLSSRYSGTDFTPLKPGRDAMLFDIHGLREDAIYCVGAGGTLQKLEGDAWVPIDLSLTYRFRGIDATREDKLRFCGDGGHCFELRDLTELVPIKAPGNVFFAVREWQGEVYWGDSAFGVYRQVDAALEEFHETRLAYDLRCDENFLYAVGTDAAWRYDGAVWTSVRLVYDDGNFTLV